MYKHLVIRRKIIINILYFALYVKAPIRFSMNASQTYIPSNVLVYKAKKKRQNNEFLILNEIVFVLSVTALASQFLNESWSKEHRDAYYNNDDGFLWIHYSHFHNSFSFYSHFVFFFILHSSMQMLSNVLFFWKIAGSRQLFYFYFSSIA